MNRVIARISWIVATIVLGLLMGMSPFPSAWAGEDLASLRAKAEEGDIQAQNTLGWFYLKGQGVPQDYRKAAHWIRLAANQWNPWAEVTFGLLYVHGQGVPQDYGKAAKWYRKAANQGYAPAQLNLGLLYKNGQGVHQDYGKAAHWTRLAAAQGNAVAQDYLGWFYEKGQGVPQDYGKAAEWLRKSATQGNVLAQGNLGLLYKNGQGVPQDYGKAAHWTRLAAAQGNAVAQDYLGWFYEKGQGVPQDYAKAAEWLRKSAAQGNVLAQGNLGWLYQHGKGVPQDYGKAAEWFRKSANQGNANAQFTLGWFYEKGLGIPQDYAKAAEWYRKSANQGFALAPTNLGVLYAKGQGVPQDYGKAYKWLLLGKAAGNGNAEKGIKWLLPRMTSDQIAEGQRLASQWWEAKNGSTPTALTQANSSHPSPSEKASPAPPSSDLSKIKQLIEAQNKEAQSLEARKDNLISAAIRGDVGAVRALLLRGADVNQADQYGNTPLSEAALYDYADVVRVLLANGATPKKIDLGIAKGMSKFLIRKALNGVPPSSFGPLIARNDTSPSASPTPHTDNSGPCHGINSNDPGCSGVQNSNSQPATSPAQPAPPSSDLSEIKQLIEAQNKEIQSLEARTESRPSNPSSPVYHSSVDRPSFHLPPSRSSYALVIGVEHYPGSIPHSEFSDHDAQAVFQNMRALGIPLDHIKRLTDDTATKSRIDGALHWLARNVRSDSTVWVYFSGHGAPGRKGTAYLVPFDGDPTDLSDTGVRIETLYKKLNALKARHIIVALDSCFSGQGSRSVIGRVRPLVLKVREGAFPSSGKLIAFSAAKSDQEAGVLKDQGHGLFTYYFLKGLNKGALHQGHVTIAGLYRYLNRRVTDKANLDNRSQTPMVQPELSRDGSVRLR